MEVNTPRKLKDYLAQVEIGCYNVVPGTLGQEDPPLVADQGNPFEHFGELQKMFEPLGLMPGTYMVTGIEGKFYDGYNDPDEKPWPLEVTPGMSAFDIMLAVEKSEANGYLDVNHVWFEHVDIDVMAMTIHFSMGS